MNKEERIQIALGTAPLHRVKVKIALKNGPHRDTLYFGVFAMTAKSVREQIRNHVSELFPGWTIIDYIPDGKEN